VTRRSNATGTRERRGATEAAGLMSNGDILWASSEALDRSGTVVVTATWREARARAARRSSAGRSSAAGNSSERIVVGTPGAGPVSGVARATLFHSNPRESQRVAVTCYEWQGVTAPRSLARSGTAMEACEDQGSVSSLGAVARRHCPAHSEPRAGIRGPSAALWIGMPKRSSDGYSESAARGETQTRESSHWT